MKSLCRRFLSTTPRTFVKWSEVSAVLRPFYQKVHPDLFMNFPPERITNEESLKSLNSYLEALTKSQIPTERNLTFFVKEAEILKKIEIDLKGRGILDAVKSILISVQLPTKGIGGKLSLRSTVVALEEDDFGYRRPYESYWNLHSDDLSDFRKEKETGLLVFLDENVQTAVERSLAAQPMRDEVARVEAQVLLQFGLEKVIWDCGWGIAHYRAGLLALLNLRDHYKDIRDVLGGHTLVFGQWTGVSLEGHIVLSTGEVRHNWLRFLRDLQGQTKFVKWVPHSEKQLSAVLRGMMISHHRLNGRTLASSYIVQVDKMTKSLQRWLWLNNFPEELPLDLSSYTLVVENDAGPLMVSQSGEVIVPSSCPAEVFVDFLTHNLELAEIATARNAENVTKEDDLRERTIHKFGLVELSRDENISSGRMVECLQALLDNSEQIASNLDSCHLRISNCYSIQQDGVLCIPARWKL